MKSFPSAIWMACLVSTWLVGNGARAQFDDLVQYVPETANALVLVNAKKLFDSPIAQREGWQSSREQRFAAGLTSIPPNASRLAIAAELDVEVMRASWEVAVGEMETQILLSNLARRLGGALDEVNTVPAVRLPDDSFVLQFPDGLFGAMTPGNRQQVSRWINRVNRALSPYLKEAVGYADSNADIIMVLDLQNAFSSDNVEQGLARLESVQNSKVDKAELAKLVASIRGVMLGITFRDKPYGRLKIDFGQDASLISEMAKPLILDILGAHGVMIDEVADWTPQVQGKQVFLGGELNEEGLTKLASLIQLPTTALHPDPSASASQVPPAQATPTDQSQEKTVLETTKQYYDSVQRLLKHLKLKKRDMKTMGQLAQWFENYGRNVDRLPTLNVDPEMLQYSSYISSQLHGASMSLKGITIQKRVAEVGAASSSQIYGGALGNVSQYGWNSTGYGNYGRRVATNAAYGLASSYGPMGAYHSGLRQQQRAVTEVRTQARAQGATSTQQFVQNIVQATNEICQSMTDKYEVQFSPAY